MREMKDSGIEWIGEIPKDWKTEKSKYHFTNKKNVPGVHSDEYQRLSLTLNGVLKRDKEDSDGLQPKDFNTYQLLKENELVFKLIDLQNISTSRVGLAHDTGLVSPAYIVLKPNKDMNPKFAEYYFLMLWYRDIFNALGDAGVRSSLGVEDLLHISICFPPFQEQSRIASFLDSKCSEIDSLHSDIEKEIETLKEYKKSVITEAVTKGLNPNVEMKDSGVEWIEEIAKNYSVSKIKYISNVFGRIGFRGYTQDDLVSEGEGAITLSPSNFNEMKMSYKKCSYISWHKYYESPEIMIYPGDILFVKTGSSYGKNCYVDAIPEKCTINPQLIVFKNIKVNNKWFSYYLQTNYIDSQANLAVVGGTIPTMSQEKILNFIVIVPPITEQNEIVSYLDSKCSEIDSIIESKQQQSETLEQYKKSLIYEYVTGKKEVPYNA